MILYSVTINIDEDVEAEWLQWMRGTHIPDVMKTGLFLEYRMFKLLNEDINNGGTTYSIQYFCRTVDTLNLYLEQFAPALQDEHYNRYPNKFVAFRTFLEELT